MSKSKGFNTLANVFQMRQSPSPVKRVKDERMFFAVALLPGVSLQEEDVPPFIFADLSMTLCFCKRYREQARWKKFQSREEAEAFCRDVRLEGNSYQSGQEKRANSVEKSSFRAPKPQDLVKLRKLITSGDLDAVKALIWSNPRYLIGSGDTPTVLQEGCRYNALHVAAQSNQARIIEEVLVALRSESLFKKMYPDDTEETTLSRMTFLADLYLNTPDKTRRGETPLHFACKLGSYECTKVLLAQNECLRNLTNSEGLTGREIICERTGFEPIELINKIDELFEDDTVFIPILRDEDGRSVPSIGTPMIPRNHAIDPNNPPNGLQPFSVKFGGTVGSGRRTERNTVVYSPKREMKISAFIGPLSPKQVPSIMRELKERNRKSAETRLTDAEKGLESVARAVARKSMLSWKEYWPFLEEWCDLGTLAGVSLLENHFRKDLLERTIDYCDYSTPVRANGRPSSPPTTPLGRDQQTVPPSKNNTLIQKDLDDEKRTETAISLLFKYLDCLVQDDDVASSPDLGTLLTTPSFPEDHPRIVSEACEKILRISSSYEVQHLCSVVSSIEDDSDFVNCVVQMCTEFLAVGKVVMQCSCCDEEHVGGEDVIDRLEASRIHQDINPESLIGIEYIHGSVPTKTDYQIWSAMSPVRDSIEDIQYPCVAIWVKNMTNFSNEQMKTWSTPFRNTVLSFTSGPSTPSASAMGNVGGAQILFEKFCLDDV